MYEMILYLASKNKTVSIDYLQKETGLSITEILRILKVMSFKGKINYLNLNKISCNCCNNCFLRKNIKKGGAYGVIFK
jgi:hypothetical protein